LTKAGGIGVDLRFGWSTVPVRDTLSSSWRWLAGTSCRSWAWRGGLPVVDPRRRCGEAVAAALPVGAGTYNIVDDQPLTKRAYAEALAAAAGARPWVRGPGRLALLLGDRLTSLTRSLRVRNARFKQASGWQPRHRSATEG